MNNDLLKRYIDDQPTKIVTKLDFATGKLSYDKIVQCQRSQWTIRFDSNKSPV